MPANAADSPPVALDVLAAVARARSCYPAIRAAQARAAAAGASARRLAASSLGRPHLLLQAAASDRGSGFLANGQPSADGGHGALPDTPNWAVGLSVNYSLGEGADRKAKSRVERHNEEAEAARYDQVVQALQAQRAQADALVTGAVRTAANTPVQLRAARDTHTQVAARYREGLATVTDVNDSEQLLARAEAEDALARLGVWRALLAAARAAGDLSPWLERVRAAMGAARDR
ncbi:MAG: TolC family protein [Candidatus Wallbacteria bacterium]|nr:TolC family protein [Candidatus Wallbacteria bacterium]